MTSSSSSASSSRSSPSPSPSFSESPTQSQSLSTVNTPLKSKGKSNYDIFLRAIITGDSCSGKTCIVRRYIDGVFEQNFITTILLDFGVRMLEQDQKKIKLQMWDTGGQERFRTLTKAYYRNVNGCIFVCDLTDYKTFESLNFWMKEYQHTRLEERLRNGNNTTVSSNPDCLVLVANKADLPQARQISNEELRSWAAKNGIDSDMIFETSAKMNINIDEMYDKFTKKMIEHMMKTKTFLSQSDKSSLLKLDGGETNENENKSKCCS